MEVDIDVFIIWHQKAIVTDLSGTPLLFKRHELPAETAVHFWAGRSLEHNYYIIHLDNLPVSISDYSLKSLRHLLGEISESLWGIIGKGVQLIEWYQSHQFCSRCGYSTVLNTKENACECTHCHYLLYPRINPCIMVLIKRESQILLARSSRHQSTHYSLIAGFIEAGESAEEAIHREVFEEVGLKVHNLHYVCSQSWPFPHSLMLGFTADYLSGQLCLYDKEIGDAQWFDHGTINSVKLPDQGTLSHRLIHYWLDNLI